MTKGYVRVAEWPDEVLSTDTASYAVVLDEYSSTETYVGEAAPGSSQSDPVWRIKKVDTSSGVTVTWAEGSSDFSNRWDQRLSLSYS